MVEAKKLLIYGCAMVATGAFAVVSIDLYKQAHSSPEAKPDRKDFHMTNTHVGDYTVLADSSDIADVIRFTRTNEASWFNPNSKTMAASRARMDGASPMSAEMCSTATHLLRGTNDLYFDMADQRYQLSPSAQIQK
jgi:hypothetical protein